MHLHWERSSNTAGDCHIRSLSWMGRVPDEIPQDEGWKLNRNHYYQEGWLSTANLRGVVGVTYTKSHYGEATHDPPYRTNYNLRGHRAEVTLVKWNEPYQKLASCDSSGIIFVWIKYEGRWSIELINDRNTPVICFSWSHDGRMALICYQDGFVLVGSVTGQRYWSTLLSPDVNSVTSATWTPDDQQVYLGTSQGGLLVLDIDGNTIAQVTLKSGVSITDLSWNCERFNMEEQQQQQLATNDFTSSSKIDGKSYVLAVCFKNGDILLMRSYDDVIPQMINTGLQNFVVDWTNSGEMLAVAGKYREYTLQKNHSFIYVNFLHFYNDDGELIYRIRVPSDKSPVTSMTWGHNDKRLFVATGNQIHVAWVSPTIASLQLLSRLKIHSTLSNLNDVDYLPLPCRLRNLVGILFTQTIKCYIPDPLELRKFVITPPPNDGSSFRFHCTMIRHGKEEGANSIYTLYLEHLGGFLPLLKGKKISKIRPDFIIYDPQLNEESSENWKFLPLSHYLKFKEDENSSPSSSSSQSIPNNESEEETSNATPRSRRRGRRRRDHVPRYFGYVGTQEVDYINVLPENNHLAEVISNFWGTKFKLIGRNPDLLPLSLGQITYKASLLHLQPRQMRLELIDLKDNQHPFTSSRDSSNIGFSEDEEDEDEETVKMKDDILTAAVTEKVAPVAPLPSRLSFCVQPSHQRPQCSSSDTNNNDGSSVVSAIVESSEEPTIKRTTVVSPSSVSKQILNGNDVCLMGGRTITPMTSSSTRNPTLINSKSPLPVAEPERSSLRISVSCDNYLNEGIRWAAKAEDVMTPTEPESSGLSNPPQLLSPHMPVSCSANQLDSIVDILGVPSEILSQRNDSKRLFLQGEKSKKRNKRRPPIRSRSCEDKGSYNSHEQSCSSNRINGLPCRNCRLRDAELNREIFDIPTPPQVPEEEEDEDEEYTEPEKKSSIDNENGKRPKSISKLDAVWTLLEKARNILGKNKAETNQEIESCPKSPVHRRKRPNVSSLPTAVSISSPSSPLQIRKNRPNSSFSPISRKSLSDVRESECECSIPSPGSILNSPLLRRKHRLNKSSNLSNSSAVTDSSEEEFLEEKSNDAVTVGYRNLETFQKNKLKQKIKRFHQCNTGMTTSNRDCVPRPVKTSRTPSTTPDCSPFLNRKFTGRNDAWETEEINRQHKRLKKLILYNKSPMWNDFSQVYQLDFGGRVTQESAKNFQIEYKGKQVMQFGRIDGNAYTLDFQYPFCALQAFAVALANVTQRLK